MSKGFTKGLAAGVVIAGMGFGAVQLAAASQPAPMGVCTLSMPLTSAQISSLSSELGEPVQYVNVWALDSYGQAQYGSTMLVSLTDTPAFG